MQHSKYIIKTLLSTILFAFFSFAICRLLFLFNNPIFINSGSNYEIFKSFLWGVKFDSVYIFYAFLPLIFFNLIPLNFILKKYSQLIFKIYYTFVLTLGVLLNIIDVFYFNFTQKRTGVELFYLIKDPANPILGYVRDYWHAVFILMIFIFITFKTYPKFEKQKFLKYRFKDLLVSLAIICITFISLRGGLGLKPLKSTDASKYVSNGREPLVLNTPFQIISSIDTEKPKQPFERIPFSEDFDSLQIKNYKNNEIISPQRNIVLIILESFGRDYVGFLTKKQNRNYSLTPFIDSLAKSSLVFTNCYANGTKSIDAVPALFSSLPSVLDQPFIYSWYQANTVRGIHSYLNEIGYNNSFYHGAANGTMGFESFLKKSGNIDYFGLNQYPERNRDYDGNWGIYDHLYFKYFSNELAQKKQPYFSTIFSLSSHPPYAIPDSIKPLIVDDPAEINRSFAYTDYSLKKFFEDRETKPDHKNTVYIFIGDHSTYSDNVYFYTAKGKMELFCMIYDPSGEIKPGINSKTVQQLDIMPTILNLAGYQEPFFSIGNSFFDTTTKGRAMFRNNDFYNIVEYEHIFMNSAQGISYFKFQPKKFFNFPVEQQPNFSLQKNMRDEMKQTIQVFFDRMENNNFY